MKVKNLILASIAGSAAILSAPVLADSHGHDRGWHGNPHFAHRYYAPPRVVYAPPPRVFYAPAPAAVYSPPVVASPGVSIRFNLPL
jgi:hypothetical protein